VNVVNVKHKFLDNDNDVKDDDVSDRDTWLVSSHDSQAACYQQAPLAKHIIPMPMLLMLLLFHVPVLSKAKKIHTHK
jgi:hypothetical protein